MLIAINSYRYSAVETAAVAAKTGKNIWLVLVNYVNEYTILLDKYSWIYFERRQNIFVAIHDIIFDAFLHWPFHAEYIYIYIYVCVCARV